MIALRQAARNNEFDSVVVYAFDCFARQQVHQAVIIDDLPHHGFNGVCVTENYDDSPVGQFIVCDLLKKESIEQIDIPAPSLSSRFRLLTTRVSMRLLWGSHQGV